MNETGSPSKTRSLGTLAMYCAAVGVGIIGGLGAVLFRATIAVFHNFFFEGRFSTVYDANIFTPMGPWHSWIVFAPIIGAIAVAYLVSHFAPEAKGHGVPEVMEAVYYKKGLMRPIVVWIKALASAISIGSGGSVGREGPIIQIGAAMGSWIATKLNLTAWQRIVLLACGAASGIAATFNTPIGGVLFAVEIILHEVSAKTLVPVVIATATASYIGRLFFGPDPSFVIPSFQTTYFHPTNPFELIAYAVLGAILGFVSVLVIKSIYGFEDFFEQRVPGGSIGRHVIGMAIVGVIITIMMKTTGHYYVEGVGYSTVQEILAGGLKSLPLLLLLFALKLFVTCLTLGSGGSGGVFSPSLFLGATIGAALGLALSILFPELGVSAPAFAVTGMAGMIGGVTGAAVTAIVMVFEMTRDYNVIIPMTFTVAIAYGVRTIFSRQSIYTMKLARRGEAAPDAMYNNLVMTRPSADFMLPIISISGTTKILEFLSKYPKSRIPDFVVTVENGGLTGVVTASSIFANRDQDMSLIEIADTKYKSISKIEPLLTAARLMHESESDFAIVSEPAQNGSVQPLGIITRGIIGSAIVDSSDVLSV